LVDIDKSLTFPPCTGVLTDLRPDIVIYSPSIKHLIWAELTVPQERRIQKAALLKEGRYKELKTWVQIKEWIVHDYTVEVGALGFIGQYFRKFLSAIGITGPQLKFVLDRISKAARRSSFYIWNARYAKEWIAPTLYSTPVQEPRNPSQTFPRRQAVAPSVSPALVFLNTKVNANEKLSPAKVVSVSSSDPLIPPKSSSAKPSKVPLISPTQGHSSSPIVGERNTLQSIRAHNRRVSNEKLWTSWSKFEQRPERNLNPARRGWVFSQVLNRSIPKLLLACERFASAMDTLKNRGRRKSKRKSSTSLSLVKIEEEDLQEVPIEIRAQHNDLLDDFDPDSDDLDLDLQLEEDIRLEQQLHERELQRELSPSVVLCRTPWLNV